MSFDLSSPPSLRLLSSISHLLHHFFSLFLLLGVSLATPRMDRSFALGHVHRVREQNSGIGAKGLQRLLVKLKGLEKLDLKTLKELMKQDDEVSRSLLESLLRGRKKRGSRE